MQFETSFVEDSKYELPWMNNLTAKRRVRKQH